MSAHMDQLLAQFENFRAKVRQAEANFAGVSDMQERIAQVESTATSPDGNVTVVAGASGTVTDLRLAPGAMRLDAAQLSAMIMSTMRRAVADAVQQQAGIVDNAFGDAFGINTSEQVRQAQAEAFGTPEQEPASQQQSPQQAPSSSRRPSRPNDDNDDYFDQSSIFRR
ncbi:YbaB/EbfC family nucleoid-associated protein [Saccharomonospora sp. NPDC046836]|uniref:YbaB/EbfC family nucleoid-associated protein n=1 Tax=Saccharomonospora sp. NPDC046836 TaxID=3156921 RepID=UPI0033D39B27